MRPKLPASLPPSYSCWCLSLPDDSDWRQWIRGALLSLSYQNRWDEDPSTVTQDEAHDVFLEVYRSMTPCIPLPIGGIIEWPSNAAIPDGFLECVGQSLSTSDYPELFGVLQYTWGGSGSSFNLPDKRDRTTIGSGNSYSLAQNLGEATVSLSSSQNGLHSHNMQATIAAAAPGAVPVLAFSATPIFQTANSGSGSPHNNMQPSQASRFIIATGR